VLSKERKDDWKEDQTIVNHFHGVSSSSEDRKHVWYQMFLDPTGKGSCQMKNRIHSTSVPCAKQVLLRPLEIHRFLTICFIIQVYIFNEIQYLVYYETIKKKLNRRLIYECRCDERLNLKLRDLNSSHILFFAGVHRRYSK
jgi:hypothetical protein